MPNYTELYQSDIFGLTSTLIEQTWQRASAEQRPALADSVFAIFNGAEGDVSACWSQQGGAEAVRLGSLLATNLLGCAAFPVSPAVSAACLEARDTPISCQPAEAIAKLLDLTDATWLNTRVIR